MRYMSEAFVAELLERYNGAIITVVFRKRTNGEMRELNGRVGVKKYVKGDKGKGPSYDPKAYNLFTIFDMALAGKLPEAERGRCYRCVPLDQVTEIRAAGRSFKAED